MFPDILPYFRPVRLRRLESSEGRGFRVEGWELLGDGHTRVSAAAILGYRRRLHPDFGTSCTYQLPTPNSQLLTLNPLLFPPNSLLFPFLPNSKLPSDPRGVSTPTPRGRPLLPLGPPYSPPCPLSHTPGGYQPPASGFPERQRLFFAACLFSRKSDTPQCAS